MKRIRITERLLESMRRGFEDPELQANNFVVFETVAVNSLPLNKPGTIFNNAVITESILQEMASQVNAIGGAVPVILQHNSQGEDTTPSGKAFEGAVYPTPDGRDHELRLLFAMPNPDSDQNKDRASVTTDIDDGLISEVSIGALFKHLYSAASPDFDWFDPEVDFDLFWRGEDDEGNSIHKDETHGIAKGLTSWPELSLVVRGASKGAVISSLNKQKLSRQYDDSGIFRRLAAKSDFDIEQFVTFSSAPSGSKKKIPSIGEFNMDAKAILAELTEKGVEMGRLTAKLEASEAKVIELQTSQEASVKSIETLTAENAKLKTEVGDLTTKLSEAPEGSEVEFNTVMDFVKEHLDAAVIASGKTDVETEKMDATKMVAFIKEAGVYLHQLVGSEGKANAGGVNKDLKKSLNFLKANRREQ